MIFILFDIETIFLYPWAVIYRDLKMFAFVEMFIFVMLVLAGFFFIWKKGVFDWAHSVQADKKAVTEAEARRAA
jgi:NADH-quinone oxidoreductase subunit A